MQEININDKVLITRGIDCDNAVAASCFLVQCEENIVITWYKLYNEVIKKKRHVKTVVLFIKLGE